MLYLLTGNCQWRWFDPTNGTYGVLNILQNSAGNVTFKKPDEKDWVLHIATTSGSNIGTP